MGLVRSTEPRAPVIVKELEVSFSEVQSQELLRDVDISANDPQKPHGLAQY